MPASLRRPLWIKAVDIVVSDNACVVCPGALRRPRAGFRSVGRVELQCVVSDVHPPTNASRVRLWGRRGVQGRCLRRVLRVAVLYIAVEPLREGGQWPPDARSRYI